MEQIIYIQYGTKKYPLIITPADDKDLIENEPGAVRIRCDEVNLDQFYNIEDIGRLLQLFPELIEMAKEQEEKRNDFVRVRFSPREKSKLQLLASQNGFKNLSAYIRANTLRQNNSIPA